MAVSNQLNRIGSQFPPPLCASLRLFTLRIL